MPSMRGDDGNADRVGSFKRGIGGRSGDQASRESDGAEETRFLSADGGAKGVGEGLGEALDVGVVFGFDHDAGELLRAGVAQDDAAIFAESGLGFGERARDFGKRFERGLGFYFDVDDDLREVLKAFDQGFDLAVHGN